MKAVAHSLARSALSQAREQIILEGKAVINIVRKPLSQKSALLYARL